MKIILLWLTTDKLLDLKVINGDEDYLVMTNNGQVIRSPISQVRLCGRNSSGVKIINLKEGEKVSSFTILPHEEQEENAPLNEETSNSEASNIKTEEVK